MALFLAQVLLLCGVVATVVASVAFLAFGLQYAIRRRARRGFLVTSCFIAGAVAGGFVVWQLLPAQWSLSLWSTLKATVDTETYGHAVEHYAEGVVVMLTAAALAGGACAAAVTAFLTRDKLAA
jgi:hypothetical protein